MGIGATFSESDSFAALEGGDTYGSAGIGGGYVLSGTIAKSDSGDLSKGYSFGPGFEVTPPNDADADGIFLPGPFGLDAGRGYTWTWDW